VGPGLISSDVFILSLSDDQRGVFQIMIKKNAIRLADGRYFLEWHKFFNRQGDRAVFHNSSMQVFFAGMDELNIDYTVLKLRARGHDVSIVQVEWDTQKRNFVETVKDSTERING
jgi:hypothetical protein